MAATDTITRERLKELLVYDLQTGIFIRRIYFWGNKKGDIAGHTGIKGYLQIQIDGTRYQAHRLAFLYVLGYMPIEVDHINQIKTDNRWINLRSATRTVNNRNRRLGKNNKTGIYGVRWRSDSNKWRSIITANNKAISLGSHTCFFEACCARKSAENKYGYHVNHGS